MNKRLPIAVHELKEWQKGQRELGEELKDKPAGYVGARVAKRLTTDCYARGVCRGAVECANLTTRAVANDPTSPSRRRPFTRSPCDLASSSWTRPPLAKPGRLSPNICGRICGRVLGKGAWSPAPSGRSMVRGGAPRKSMSSAPSSSRATSASSKPSGPSLWRR